jgi:hypothetical protein
MPCAQKVRKTPRRWQRIQETAFLSRQGLFLALYPGKNNPSLSA